MATRAELAVDPTAEQRDTKVYKHVDSEQIHALIVRGKESSWIAAWLRERYPTVDADGVELDNANANEGMHISERAITRYREKYFPETGRAIVGVVDDKLEDLIGHRLPAPVGIPWELDMLETVGVHAAQANLARAMKADNEMDMLNPITMEAHSHMVDTLAKLVDIKSRLGVKGYEAAPEKQHIFTQNEHFSVELQGRLDPATGQPMSVEPSKLELARQLLAAGPEERLQIIEATRLLGTAQPAIEASSEAEESLENVPSVKRETP